MLHRGAITNVWINRAELVHEGQARRELEGSPLCRKGDCGCEGGLRFRRSSDGPDTLGTRASRRSRGMSSCVPRQVWSLTRALSPRSHSITNQKYACALLPKDRKPHASTDRNVARNLVAMPLHNSFVTTWQIAFFRQLRHPRRLRRTLWNYFPRNKPPRHSESRKERLG